MKNSTLICIEITNCILSLSPGVLKLNEWGAASIIAFIPSGCYIFSKKYSSLQQIMKNKIPKSQIQRACTQKQEALIENFENRISMMKKDANSRNQSASQRENRTTGKLELLSTIKTELNFVRAEMKYLQSLNPENVNTTVEPGAVVITNKLNFYIAVSSEKVEIEDEVIYGISLKAPIYPAMQGLKKGDNFQFNDTVYEIKDVY